LPEPGSSTWVIAFSGAAGGVLGGLLLETVTGLVAQTLRPWVDEKQWSLEGKVCAVTGAELWDSTRGLHVTPDVAAPPLARTVWVACEEMTGEHWPK